VITKQKLPVTTKAAPVLLALAPAPMQLKAQLRSDEDVLQHRRLYCGHYDQCLNQSVYSGWAGFSCSRCPMRDLAVQGATSEPFAHQRRSFNPNQ
jgi:hypothetical protein